MIKNIKTSLETDLATVTTVLARGTLNKEKVTTFPSVSLIPIGVKLSKDGENQYKSILRCGLAIFVESSDTSIIDEKCDEIYKLLTDLNYANLAGYAESIEFLGYDYDDYNSGATKGVAYIAVEITFNDL